MTSTASGVVAPVGYGPELYEELDALGVAATGTVLDIGAGLGAASEPFALRGARVSAIDTDTAALEAYRTRVPAVSAVTGDLLSLPFGDGTFDAVVAARILHLVDPAAALAEAIRVTKPGGRIAVWWRELSVDEPARHIRDRIVGELGLAPFPPEAPTGFRSFYGAAFRARELRVIPFVARLAPGRWIADERAAKAAQRVYGEDGGERFYRAYGDALAENAATDGAVLVRFVQFLYLGITK